MCDYFAWTKGVGYGEEEAVIEIKGQVSLV
jgi:hypothetical protein